VGTSRNKVGEQTGWRVNMVDVLRIYTCMK
jgi:hypothetical protein